MQLCWCRGACADASNFTVDVGILYLVGVFPAVLSCTLGAKCILEFAGLGTQAGDWCVETTGLNADECLALKPNERCNSQKQLLE